MSLRYLNLAPGEENAGCISGHLGRIAEPKLGILMNFGDNTDVI